MNYTELTAAIKDYTNNTGTEFTAAIPTFIKQAEQRIYRSVNLYLLIERMLQVHDRWKCLPGNAYRLFVSFVAIYNKF